MQSSESERSKRQIRAIRVARRFAPHVIAASSYIAIAIAATWPLAKEFTDHLPLGHEGVSTVPLFNAWTMWWNFHAAGQAYAGYWNAPIFYPVGNAFAFSEPMPPVVLLAPVYGLIGLPAAYNTYLLGALVLNGYATFSLLRRLRIRFAAAWFGGAMMVVLPFVMAELGVLQLLPLFPSLWALHALISFTGRLSFSRAIALGGAAGLAYLTCSYYGLFLATLLSGTGAILLCKRLRSGRMWVRLAVAAIVAAAMIAPVAAVQWRVSRQHQLQRSPELVRRFSASWSAYTASTLPWFGVLRGSAAAPERLCYLQVGWLKIGLATVGLLVGIAKHRTRQWTLFLAALLLVALLMSFGLRAEVFGWSPYAMLMKWLPGYGQIRSPFRFAVFVQVSCVLLAGSGLGALFRTASRCQAAWLRRGATCLVCLVGVAAIVELWPRPQQVVRFPDIAEQADWIDWLRVNTSTDSVLACFPLPKTTGVASYESATLWMIWQTQHERRMINGYSGFTPQTHLEQQEQLTNFPDDHSLRALHRIGVTHCVVQRSADPQSLARSTDDGRLQLVLELRDTSAHIDVYSLRPVAVITR